MPDKTEPLTKLSSLNEEEKAFEQHLALKKENEKLQLDNAALKKKISLEQLYYKNLCKQWEELKVSAADNARELEQLQSNRGPGQKLYYYVFYGLIFIAALLLIFNLASFTKKLNNTSGAVNIAPQNNEMASTLSFIATQQQKINADVTNAFTDKKSIGFAESKRPPAGATTVNDPGAKKAGSKVIPKTPSRYVVKEKSYFHNKPIANTRRSTYVLPWNDAYGILTAREEVNGFVYVVFTNRAGRTSKGWLLKGDLEPLK